MKKIAAAIAAVACFCSCTPANQPATESSDVKRIVTLAPHLTELVFAAGASEMLVGVSAYSDFPQAAKDLPIVSDAFTVDQEQLALLRPNLLLAWQSGTPKHVVDELRTAGFNVVAIRTRGLDDVATALLRIGELSGSTKQAGAAADHYRKSMARLRERYAANTTISVFYQVSARPLYTINGEHFIGEILSLCGGRNIFADLSDLAPAVSVEAVLDRNPEVLLAASDGGDPPFADWQRWDRLAANRYSNHFTIASAQIARPTPRLLMAAAKICDSLVIARKNRGAADG